MRLNLSQAEFKRRHMGLVWPAAQHGLMAKVKARFKPGRPHHFIKEWRKFRGLTQETLAERVELTPSSISQLESGKQGFTDTTLATLAEALRCEPGDLLIRNPLDPDSIWSVWDSIPESDRPAAIKALTGFVRAKAS